MTDAERANSERDDESYKTDASPEGVVELRLRLDQREEIDLDEGDEPAEDDSH